MRLKVTAKPRLESSAHCARRSGSAARVALIFVSCYKGLRDLRLGLTGQASDLLLMCSRGCIEGGKVALNSLRVRMLWAKPGD
jgi:hypothetical protein